MEYTKAIKLIETISTETQASTWLKTNLAAAMTSTDFMSFARDAKVLSEILDTLVKHSLESSQVFERKAGAYRVIKDNK